ncbi:MAG: hypothetical protein HY790_12530 [Deltaproteobacteria bacterium]|nr:hypothetical protein [Deltaproteobacteria bacterium]MBI4796639.1 hypothetical protein [Deltaproteobacteria bacterium]
MITALGILTAVGSMAVAIDLGHLFVVKSELQAAADAGAMAGAIGLLAIPPGTTGSVTITPDCSRALATSQKVVTANKADGASLTLPTADVVFGWWDTGTKAFVAGGCSDPNKVTAVKVVTRKDPTANGPVPLYFTGFFGMREKGLTAEAVGLTDYAGYAPPGAGTAPLAVDRDKVPPNNTPFKIHLNPSPDDDGCWHSYKDRSSGTSDTRDYINGTKPSPDLKVGDQINVKEGVANSALQELADQLAARTSQGKNYDVLVPVIPAGSSHSGWQPVDGFATLRITEVETQGGDKYVKGYILPDQVAPGVEPGGPNCGTRAGVPKMVQ